MNFIICQYIAINFNLFLCTVPSSNRERLKVQNQATGNYDVPVGCNTIGRWILCWSASSKMRKNNFILFVFRMPQFFVMTTVSFNLLLAKSREIFLARKSFCSVIPEILFSFSSVWLIVAVSLSNGYYLGTLLF